MPRSSSAFGHYDFRHSVVHILLNARVMWMWFQLYCCTIRGVCKQNNASLEIVRPLFSSFEWMWNCKLSLELFPSLASGGCEEWISVFLSLSLSLFTLFPLRVKLHVRTCAFLCGRSFEKRKGEVVGTQHGAGSKLQLWVRGGEKCHRMDPCFGSSSTM